MKIITALVLGLLMTSVAYADSIQQITVNGSRNCQVVTIAGQTYVNC